MRKQFLDLTSEEIEKDFGINIVNYNLIGEDNLGFFDFEIFNYNFDTHRAVKSEFVKIPNIRKVSETAEAVLKQNRQNKKQNKQKAIGKAIKNRVEPSKETFIEKSALKSASSSKSKVTLDSQQLAKQKKPAVKRAEALTKEIDEICGVEDLIYEKKIGEQIDLISLSWSLLSPSENTPVLEAGEPVEIAGESMVRIYFQKPNVRHIFWRFRKKPEAESSKPILRVYKGNDMLWYDVLDSHFGSRYIIFPEELELSQTWVEIGYLTERGDFIFIARSPVWPPDCLLKKLPKLKLERKISTNRILLGATESIPGGKQLPANITVSGAGFSGSGAGITMSGTGTGRH